MVRGLVIRQLFLLLDLVLVLAILAMGGLLVHRVVRGGGANLDAAAASNVAPIGVVTLPSVKPEAEYDVITKNKLFGPAGEYDAAKPAPVTVEKVDTDLKETELNLKLMGTVALGPESAFSSATIQDLDARSNPRSYILNEDIRAGVKLVAVWKRKVDILNSTFNPPRKEYLSMDDEEGYTPPVQVAQAQDEGARGSNRITVDRNEIADELMNNYSDLLKIKPVAKRDSQGNVIGLTADDISQYPLAQKLGLEDGDVLQTVNNEKIDSQAKIMEMVQKYQHSRSFRIGIIRDGKPQIITYNLR